MSKLRSFVRSLKKTDLVWRYGSNLSDSLNYKIGGNRLNSFESQIVNKLDTDGIVVTSVDALFEGNSEFQTLDTAVTDLLKTKKTEIEKLKLQVNDETIGSKTFNLETLGSELTFDADDVFARFALNTSLLNIANAYFRMQVKLRYYNVWYTFASSSTARESQLWHFDREDNYILKLFLYLDDVDEGAGPFTYAPGTHRRGKHRSIKPDFILEDGVRRTTDEQMQAVFPKERWIKGVGKKGTLIFADTRGFHKGGEARTRDRLMYTCMFTSQASESKQLIKYRPGLAMGSLTPKQLAALHI